jgi:5-methylcytosine-specific restriction endonuclease McrA
MVDTGDLKSPDESRAGSSPAPRTNKKGKKMNVLALDAAGLPRKWINFEDAVSYQAKEMVIWSLGETLKIFRGGINNDGIESRIEVPSIIAVRGTSSLDKFGRVALTNKTLFSRDRHLCAYCGNNFSVSHLSRDHVIPRCEGGKDAWTNVVTACKPCNMKKGRRLLEDINMKLLYVPYEPNHYENMILSNRNILTDQMEYLMSGVPKNSRVRDYVGVH